MHYSLKEKKIYDIPPFINNNNPFIYEQYISIPKSNNKLPLSLSLSIIIHVFIYFYLIFLFDIFIFRYTLSRKYIRFGRGYFHVIKISCNIVKWLLFIIVLSGKRIYIHFRNPQHALGS
jgi:hypothetical protein